MKLIKMIKNLDFLTDSYKNNFNFEIGINQEVFLQSVRENLALWIDL